MRVAAKLLSLPVLLFAASAVGAIGSWGLPVGAVLLLLGCVAGAVTMESRDLASVEGLSPVRPSIEAQLPQAA
jgi:hypothetical protein